MADTLQLINNRWHIIGHQVQEFSEPFTHRLRWDVHHIHLDGLDPSWQGAYAQADYARNAVQWWVVRHFRIHGYQKILTTPEAGDVIERLPIKPPRGHASYRWEWNSGAWHKRNHSSPRMC